MGAFNPLLQQCGDLPFYSLVRAEHVLVAIEQIVDDNWKAIKGIIDSQSQCPTWDDFVLALDALHARAARCLNTVKIIGTASGGAQWRKAILGCEEKHTRYMWGIHTHQQLFQLYEKLAKSAIAKQFERPRKVLLEKVLLDYRLAGIGLSADQRNDLQALESRINAVSLRFYNNVHDASQNESFAVDDEAYLVGLSYEDQLRMEIVQEQTTLWRVSLDDPQLVQTVLANVQLQSLREKTYKAFVSRASDPKSDYDNARVLDLLLNLRLKKARLLGFTSSAQLKLESMALTSTNQVTGFLYRHLKQKVPGWRREAKELKGFAVQEGLQDLKPWDYSFYAQRLRMKQGAISEEVFKTFFEVEQVLKSLFALPSRLFGIEFLERPDLDAWHASVRPIEVREHGQTMGYLFLDLFARKEKKGRAGRTLLAQARQLTVEGRELTLPTVVLSCGLPQVAKKTPLLLKHGQLQTLFHEFGHCLHHLLDRSDCWRLSGSEGIGRDAQVFFSKLMEQWCHSPDFLSDMSRHYQTGVALSQAQTDQLRTFLRTQTGLQSANTLAYALLDYVLHLKGDENFTAREMASVIFDTFLVLPSPEMDKSVHSFDHLVTGSEAAYFTHVWGEALAKEVFARFEAKGLFDPVEGKRLRDEVYAPGASRSFLESIEAFLGHAPRALMDVEPTVATPSGG